MCSNDNVLSFLPTLNYNSTLFQLGKKKTSFLNKAQERVCWLEGSKEGGRGDHLAGDFYFEISWQKLIRRIM